MIHQWISKENIIENEEKNGI